MTESEKHQHRCCFADHRPEGILLSEAAAKDWLRYEITTAIDAGYTTFITGMGMGVDIWAAQVVLELRETNPFLHLIAVEPYPSFPAKWSKEWLDAYNDVLSRADLVKQLYTHYHPVGINGRIMWMVGHSSRLICTQDRAWKCRDTIIIGEPSMKPSERLETQVYKYGGAHPMITSKDRFIVRELAKQVRDRAELPIMEARRALWYQHNDLKTTRPIIATFPEVAWHEIIPPESLQCENEEFRFMETILRGKLFRADVIRDDVPIERTWEVTKIITDDGFVKGGKGHASVANNPDYRDNCLGGINYLWLHSYKFNPNAGHFDPIIKEYEDLDLIKTPEVTYHEKESMEKLAIHQDALGDILDVQFRGQKWLYFAMMETYTNLRGLQEVMEDIYEEPEMLEDGMERVAQAYHELLDQYVKYDLLDLNNDQSYSGSGGLNYTHDLPKYPGGAKDTRNFWGFCESQEFTMVGPEQHWQFVMKHEAKMAERFGLFSYGCCEPADKKLKYILTIPGIRRISVSPWADVEVCAEQIKDKAVYSWKPMPSTFINSFDAMEPLVRRMLEATKKHGCCPEIVLKDTGTCNNDPASYGRFTELCRRLIEEYYG